MNSTTFVLAPIPADEAHTLRHNGGPIYVADSVPGYPCRQCLRDADIGEELILVSHDPFAGSSQYRSSSPIFLHREPCAPFTGDSLPKQLTRRMLSVRSFDADEMMIKARVIDGTLLKETLSDFFADVGSEKIHVHNAERGCWAATVVRVPTPAE